MSSTAASSETSLSQRSRGLRRVKGQVSRSSITEKISFSVSPDTKSPSAPAENIPSQHVSNSTASPASSPIASSTSLNNTASDENTPYCTTAPVVPVSNIPHVSSHVSTIANISTISSGYGSPAASLNTLHTTSRPRGFVHGDFLSDYFSSDSLAPRLTNNAVSSIPTNTQPTSHGISPTTSMGVETSPNTSQFLPIIKFDRSFLSMFNDISPSISLISLDSLAGVSDVSDAGYSNMATDSSQSLSDAETTSEDDASIKSLAFGYKTKIRIEDRFAGVFSPPIRHKSHNVVPAPETPSWLLSSPSVLQKNQQEDERPNRTGGMGRKARLEYLSPYATGYPERPSKINISAFVKKGGLGASPGMTDISSYLKVAEKSYVSGCDLNRSEEERKIADRQYLSTITEWVGGYGPHGPWYVYDTYLKKWVREEDYDMSEEAERRRWEYYLTLRRMFRYNMNGIEFRKWTKPTDAVTGQTEEFQDASNIKTGLEWVVDFVGPRSEEMGMYEVDSSKKKKSKLPKGCPAFWLDPEESDNVQKSDGFSIKKIKLVSWCRDSTPIKKSPNDMKVKEPKMKRLTKISEKLGALFGRRKS